MKLKVVAILLALIIPIGFIGCAGAPISTKAKATMILNTYNAQGKLAVKDAIDCNRRGPACSDAERDNIQKRKDLLVKMDALVTAYGIIAKGGGTPSQNQEDQIYSMIDELVGLSQ